MFNLCGVCKTSENKPSSGYLVKKQNEPDKFYTEYEAINQVSLSSPQISMLRVSRSTYDIEEVKNKAKSKVFTDQEFGPQEQSLGQFEGVSMDKWKRVTELGEGITMFGHEIQPKQATYSNLPNKTMQAVLACLAQLPGRIHAILGSQESSAKNGVCLILLRFKGQIQQIVIDNYIPVDSNSRPLFCQPVDNAYWPLLMQKARAKAYGSYQKMIDQGDDVRRCLQQFTFAPTDTFKTQNMGKQQLWEVISQATSSSTGAIKPVLGYTSSNSSIKWSNIHLTPNHYYTIIGSATLSHKLGSSFKILKLRNAFKVEQYQGDGSKSDQLFWDQVESNQQKSRILSTIGNKQGIIYMLYSDYLKYFECTFVSQIQESIKYNSQQLVFDQRQSGVIYRMSVEKEGSYCISVDQNDMSSKEGQEFGDGWSRCTILLIRDNSSTTTDYQYAGGVLRYNEQHPTLRTRLSPGKYLIYIKLDPTLNRRAFPKQTHLVVYSSQAAHLKQINRKQMSDLIRRVFLNHARNNKRQFYNNDLMWSSWKLVAQGGYAYLAFGNSKESKFKFVVKIDKQILLQENYAIKYPDDNTSVQTIEIKPGSQEIILLRVCNSEVKQINFPPPVDLQILPLL